MKQFYGLIMLASCLLFSGCAMEVTTQQSDIISEYMSSTLLKNTKGYEDELYNPDDIKEKEQGDVAVDDGEEGSEDSLEEENTEDTTLEVDTDSSKEPDVIEEVQYTFDELIQELGYDDFSVEYAKSTLYDAYPNINSYYTIEPSKGNSLFVVSFDVTNTSKKSQRLNLMLSQFTYQLHVNGKTYTPMLTLLSEDLQYIDMEFGSKESKQAVVVFDVEKDIDISETELVVSYGDKSTIIHIK